MVFPLKPPFSYGFPTQTSVFVGQTSVARHGRPTGHRIRGAHGRHLRAARGAPWRSRGAAWNREGG